MANLTTVNITIWILRSLRTAIKRDKLKNKKSLFSEVYVDVVKKAFRFT